MRSFRLHRQPRFEPLERREMLSVTVTGPNNGAVIELQPLDPNDPIIRAIEFAADLDNYTVEQLASTQQWVVVLDGGGVSDDDDDDGGGTTTASAGQVGATSLQSVELLGQSYIWEFPKHVTAQNVASQLGNLDGVEYYYPMVSKERVAKFIPNDPYFDDQWYLRNTGQSGGTPGIDIGAEAAWDTATGVGVVIAIVDDGVQYTHPDLAGNYRADLSWDIQDGDPFPEPLVSGSHSLDDFHGTAVAGIAVGNGDNSLGISGAAPDAQFAALRLISQLSTDYGDAGEALALSHKPHEIDIYNNSWGAPDAPGGPGTWLDRPGPLTTAALLNGTVNGRRGLGNIYTFAGGDGRLAADNVNYDGYANSRFTIAVGAVDHNGEQAIDSEPGAPLLVVAPSGGRSSAGMTTTDLTGAFGYNRNTGSDGDGFADLDYTSTFSDTSGATPLVSGVIALMLDANPNLTNRDVQHILVHTARMIDPTDPDWVLNGAGLPVNHKYGFGMVDAEAAVALATFWRTSQPEIISTTGNLQVGLFIPDGESASHSFTVDVDRGAIEHVEISFSTDEFTYGGDYRVELVSPAGTRSVLSDRHNDRNDYDNWLFSTVRHWGESLVGEWTLEVHDVFPQDDGYWQNWQLNFFTAGRNPIADVPPDAVDDSYTVDEDGTLDLGAASVLDNDTDPEGDPLTALLVTSPAHGTLTFDEATGSFEYTPVADFNGTDTFRYVANDGTSSSLVPATVTITVNPINDAPVAVGDTYVVTEGETLSVAAPGVLDNDTDVDGDTLTAVLQTDVSGGTLNFNSNGSFNYTPTGAVGTIDSFTYTANDGTVDSNIATATIRINARPVITPDALTTDEDVPATFNIIGNDTDADPAPFGGIDPTSVVITNPPDHGTLTVNANGTVYYEPDAEYNGPDSFMYTVNDLDGATSLPGLAEIDVVFVNDPPVANDDYGTAAVNAAVTVDVLGNDIDIDPETDFDLTTVTVVTDGTHGTAVANADGTITYTPGTDFAGGDLFTYTVTDMILPGSGVTGAVETSNTATVYIRVGNPVTLSGFVYVDYNNDGVKQVDELTMDSVTVRIEKVDGPLTFTTMVTTDDAGRYMLAEGGGGPMFVPAGTYNITEVHPIIMVDGMETLGTGNSIDTPGDPVVVSDDMFSNLKLGPGEAAVDFNFGEQGIGAGFVQGFFTGRLFFASSGPSGITTPPVTKTVNLTQGSVFLTFDGGWAGKLSARAKLGSGSGVATLSLLDEKGAVIQSVNATGGVAEFSVDGTPGTGRVIELSGNHTNVDLQLTQIGSPTAPTPPGPFSALAPATSATQIDLNWSDSVDELGYHIYELVEGYSQYVATLGIDQTSYTIVSVEPGSTHTYQVRAFSDYGTTSTGWIVTQSERPIVTGLNVAGASGQGLSPITASAAGLASIELDFDETVVFDETPGAAVVTLETVPDGNSLVVVGVTGSGTNTMTITLDVPVVNRWVKVMLNPSAVFDSSGYSLGGKDVFYAGSLVADLDGNGEVGVGDLSALFAPSVSSGDAASSGISGDEGLSGVRLAHLLANWGTVLAQPSPEPAADAAIAEAVAAPIVVQPIGPVDVVFSQTGGDFDESVAVHVVREGRQSGRRRRFHVDDVTSDLPTARRRRLRHVVVDAAHADDDIVGPLRRDRR
jgi:subtilisin family serine protease/subtilisin-like proprotein convertase family protein